MPLLSVAIITLNEEATLQRTLDSVRWAEEVIVVDSGSTDRTLEIAANSGGKVFSRAWAGFASQKNFAMEQCTGTWVLSLDADEELSRELQIAIQDVLASSPVQKAFRIRRKNYFLGQFIRYGGFYPDAKLRLFRRDIAAKFEERPVHETVHLTGEAAELHGDILHYAYPTLSTYIEHMNRYSTLGADLLVAKNRVSGSSIGFLLNVLAVPYLQFLWNFIVRLGFLDGRRGLLLHWYHAGYTSWKYAKAWEKASVKRRAAQD